MSRVKIKSKTVRSTINDRDVLSMFHDVLGTSAGGAPLHIAQPKYERIKQHVDRYIALLDALHDSDAFSALPDEKSNLAGYITGLKILYSKQFTAPDIEKMLKELLAEEKKSAPETKAATSPEAKMRAALEAATETLPYNKLPKEVITEFNTAFTTAKEGTLVVTIIHTCKNLIAHKKALSNPAELRDKFLLQPPMTFSPLHELPSLNFKLFYVKLGVADRKFIMMVLHKLLSISHDVYDAISAPDMDVNEVVEIVMNSIGDVKKHIPRCDEAFDKIADSVSTLKGNFDGYYKDFVASGNPTIIMENFVVDVSKDPKTKASPKITRQFRQIIMHYRKLASQSSNDPKLQTLFNHVGKNFDELDKTDDVDSDDEGDEKDDAKSEEKAPSASSSASSLPAKKSDAAKRNQRRRAKKKGPKAAPADPSAPPSTRSADPSLGDELDAAESPFVEESPFVDPPAATNPLAAVTASMSGLL